MTGPEGDLDRARRCLRAGDAAGARRVLDSLPGVGPGDRLRPQVLELRARTSYLELDFRRATDEWEEAYAAYRAAGEQLAAIRVARTIGFMHGAVLGNLAVMNGWLARAQTLLADQPGSAEQGWVTLNVGMFESDRDERERRFREALEVARRLGDAELELVSLAYLGANLVHADRTEEGMVLLDEALAAVAGSEVDDFVVLEEVFCQLFAACEHASDVGRAEQWMRVGDALAARRGLPAVSAFCHTHYGGVLTAAGRWPEADAALREAVRLWGLGYEALRAGALVRLADLRVRQGRLEEAEQLLEGLEEHAEAARAVAALHLARGEVGLAGHVLDGALAEVDATGTAAAPLLALLVDVHLAAGDLEAARRASSRLASCAGRHGTDHLRALAALAEGKVCLAGGTGDPSACLRQALAGFGRAHLPMELAQARLALARALAADQPAIAVREARGALEAFERLQAARDADGAAALLRSLGGRAGARRARAGLLTSREEEVLGLLGHGLSNAEISERLYISRKTVEHHVGRILSKLGLRSRSEAAAYAVRQGSGSE